jgi:hypothetical protein
MAMGAHRIGKYSFQSTDKCSVGACWPPLRVALVYIRAVASCELLQELVEFNKRYSTNPEDVVAALSADPSLYVSWGTASLFDNEIAPSLV